LLICAENQIKRFTTLLCIEKGKRKKGEYEKKKEKEKGRNRK
jgi:hypothetical protein